MKRIPMLLALAMLSMIAPAFAEQPVAIPGLTEAPACAPSEMAPSPAPSEELFLQLTPEPLPATHPCHESCTTDVQRLCRSQGGYCTLHPDYGFCGCYYP